MAAAVVGMLAVAVGAVVVAVVDRLVGCSVDGSFVVAAVGIHCLVHCVMQLTLLGIHFLVRWK